MDENTRLVATAAVVIIFLSLSWVYRTSFKKNQQENSGNSAWLGIVIVLLCFLLAYYLL